MANGWLIASIAVTLIAFCWLLYETKYLTVRLPYGKAPSGISIRELISIATAMTAAVFLLNLMHRDLLIGRLITVLKQISLSKKRQALQCGGTGSL